MKKALHGMRGGLCILLIVCYSGMAEGGFGGGFFGTTTTQQLAAPVAKGTPATKAYAQASGNLFMAKEYASQIPTELAAAVQNPTTSYEAMQTLVQDTLTSYYNAVNDLLESYRQTGVALPAPTSPTHPVYGYVAAASGAVRYGIAFLAQRARDRVVGQANQSGSEQLNSVVSILQTLTNDLNTYDATMERMADLLNDPAGSAQALIPYKLARDEAVAITYVTALTQLQPQFQSAALACQSTQATAAAIQALSNQVSQLETWCYKPALAYIQDASLYAEKYVVKMSGFTVQNTITSGGSQSLVSTQSATSGSGSAPFAFGQGGDTGELQLQASQGGSASCVAAMTQLGTMMGLIYQEVANVQSAQVSVVPPSKNPNTQALQAAQQYYAKAGQAFTLAGNTGTGAVFTGFAKNLAAGLAAWASQQYAQAQASFAAAGAKAAATNAALRAADQNYAAQLQQVQQDIQEQAVQLLQDGGSLFAALAQTAQQITSAFQALQAQAVTLENVYHTYNMPTLAATATSKITAARMATQFFQSIDMGATALSNIDPSLSTLAQAQAAIQNLQTAQQLFEKSLSSGTSLASYIPSAFYSPVSGSQGGFLGTGATIAQFAQLCLGTAFVTQGNTAYSSGNFAAAITYYRTAESYARDVPGSAGQATLQQAQQGIAAIKAEQQKVAQMLASAQQLQKQAESASWQSAAATGQPYVSVASTTWQQCLQGYIGVYLLTSDAAMRRTVREDLNTAATDCAQGYADNAASIPFAPLWTALAWYQAYGVTGHPAALQNAKNDLQRFYAAAQSIAQAAPNIKQIQPASPLNRVRAVVSAAAASQTLIQNALASLGYKGTPLFTVAAHGVDLVMTIPGVGTLSFANPLAVQASAVAQQAQTDFDAGNFAQAGLEFQQAIALYQQLGEVGQANGLQAQYANIQTLVMAQDYEDYAIALPQQQSARPVLMQGLPGLGIRVPQLYLLRIQTATLPFYLVNYLQTQNLNGSPLLTQGLATSHDAMKKIAQIYYLDCLCQKYGLTYLQVFEGQTSGLTPAQLALINGQQAVAAQPAQPPSSSNPNGTPAVPGQPAITALPSILNPLGDAYLTHLTTHITTGIPLDGDYSNSGLVPSNLAQIMVNKKPTTVKSSIEYQNGVLAITYVPIPAVTPEYPQGQSVLDCYTVARELYQVQPSSTAQPISIGNNSYPAIVSNPTGQYASQLQKVATVAAQNAKQMSQKISNLYLHNAYATINSPEFQAANALINNQASNLPSSNRYAVNARTLSASNPVSTSIGVDLVSLSDFYQAGVKAYQQGLIFWVEQALLEELVYAAQMANQTALAQKYQKTGDVVGLYTAMQSSGLVTAAAKTLLNALATLHKQAAQFQAYFVVGNPLTNNVYTIVTNAVRSYFMAANYFKLAGNTQQSGPLYITIGDLYMRVADMCLAKANSMESAFASTGVSVDTWYYAIPQWTVCAVTAYGKAPQGLDATSKKKQAYELGMKASFYGATMSIIEFSYAALKGVQVFGANPSTGANQLVTAGDLGISLPAQCSSTNGRWTVPALSCIASQINAGTTFDYYNALNHASQVVPNWLLDALLYYASLEQFANNIGPAPKNPPAVSLNIPGLMPGSMTAQSVNDFVGTSWQFWDRAVGPTHQTSAQGYEDYVAAGQYHQAATLGNVLMNTFGNYYFFYYAPQGGGSIPQTAAARNTAWQALSLTMQNRAAGIFAPPAAYVG